MKLGPDELAEVAALIAQGDTDSQADTPGAATVSYAALVAKRLARMSARRG